jgi:hypothetical protein
MSAGTQSILCVGKDPEQLLKLLDAERLRIVRHLTQLLVREVNQRAQFMQAL